MRYGPRSLSGGTGAGWYLPKGGGSRNFVGHGIIFFPGSEAGYRMWHGRNEQMDQERWTTTCSRIYLYPYAQAQAYKLNPQPAPRTGQNVSRSRHRPHHSRTRNSTPPSRASPFRSPPHQPNHRPSPARRQGAYIIALSWSGEPPPPGLWIGLRTFSNSRCGSCVITPFGKPSLNGLQRDMLIFTI